MRNAPRGFIALITVLIISTVLLIAVISIAQYGIGTRFSLLDLENKTKSENFANACVGIARIAVVNDSLWTETNRVVKVENASCVIESVAPNTPNPSTSRVKVSAVVSAATTNYQVDIDEASGNIVRFVELTI